MSARSVQVLLRRFLLASGAVLACMLLCGLFFFGQILVWGLLVAPFVELRAAGPVLVFMFVLASGATVLVWHRLYRRRRRRSPPVSRL